LAGSVRDHRTGGAGRHGDPEHQSQDRRRGSACRGA
jgi:hypothetical protein